MRCPGTRTSLFLCILLVLAVFSLPVRKAGAGDKIENLIQSLKSGQTSGTGSLSSKPVNVRKIYSSLSKPVGAKKYTGKRISLDLQDADVVNVLRLLADVGGVNIVFGSDVSGKVTLNLKNIPWDQALDIVLMTNGLDKVRMGKVIRIARSETITDEANKRLAAMKASDKVEPMVTRIIPVNYSDIDKIKSSELISNILSDRGKIDIDERTNTLIVHDISKNVEQIETLVRRLDTRIPQVLIEARIVEANDGFAREVGVQWGFARGKQSKHTSSNIFGGNTGSDAFYGLKDRDTGTPAISGGDTLPVGFNLNLPATSVLSPPGTFGFNLGRFFSDGIAVLDMRLSLAQTKNLAKVISSPRIMTVDNQKANIIQGEDIPFLNTTSQNGATVEFVEANLELEVTPHVTSENTILLEVETHRDAPNFDDAVAGNPAITRNTAKTSVLLDDGEITVIGGIYVIDKTEKEEGIPGLMNLPYVGRLFRRELTDKKKKELLVFIIPKIIR